MRDIFKYQIWHLLAAILLFVCAYTYVLLDSTLDAQTLVWFYIAVSIPVAHQAYVWLMWRLELYQHTFSSRLGTMKAFKIYAVGFSILFVSRLIFVIVLAFKDEGTLAISSTLSYTILAIITPLMLYLFYSVKKYFTPERAYGIDHFDKNYNKPYEKQGIFRFTNNGMYIFGLLILYIPGLLLFSKAAIFVAVVNHLYIWVHYYTTELPDMIEIYGKGPKEV